MSSDLRGFVHNTRFDLSCDLRPLTIILLEHNNH